MQICNRFSTRQINNLTSYVIGKVPIVMPVEYLSKLISFSKDFCKAIAIKLYDMQKLIITIMLSITYVHTRTHAHTHTHTHTYTHVCVHVYVCICVCIY